MSRRPRRLAIIPARGGSKRFPRKNAARFLGVPLVVHAVRVAQQSEVFDHVVVSTEDAAIARLAVRAGAELHRRSAALAADSARVVHVCAAVLEARTAQGQRFDSFCVLLPTSPFRTARHVRESLAALETGRADVCMSLSEFPHVPFWAVRVDDGFVRLAFGRWTLKSRDRLPVLYRHNGVVLWARTRPFLRRGDFYGPRVVPYLMRQDESVDVDHEIDLKFAEFLARRARSGKAPLR